MPTIKQRRAVKKLAENGGNVSKAMRDAGYTKVTATTPKKLTASKGFQELMDEMGLTDEWLNSLLVEDLKKKPQKRTEELKLAYKLKGKLSDRVELGELKIELVEYGKDD